MSAPERNVGLHARAPIYVRAHDLAVWVLGHVRGWSAADRGVIGDGLARASRELVLATSLALTFPSRRIDALDRVDEAILELRTGLRLARDVGVVLERQVLFAAGELRAIGRMAGGWRKAIRAGPRVPSATANRSGSGAPAAPTA